MSDNEHTTQQPVTVERLIRRIAERFADADLCFGHGTDNAVDEAAWLVFSVLHLDHHGSAATYERRVSAEEVDRVEALAGPRIRDRVPGTEVVMLPHDPDNRSYRVTFGKLKAAFPDLEFVGVEAGIDEIVDVLRRGVVDPGDRRWYTVRHYQFLADVDQAFEELAIEGRVLG